MEKKIYDIIIIGGGPAGYSAGIYAARGRMKTLLVESMTVMGQATMTDEIENYPGLEKINGFELIMKFKNQATSFGLETRQGTVKSIKKRKEEDKTIWCIEDEGGQVEAYSLVIATGATAKKLAVPGEKEFLSKGVSYCATCDGAFFKDKDILVVGGGDTAVEEAIYLTRFGKKVTLVHRRDRLRATKILQERAFANDKLDFLWESVVDQILGEDTIQKVLLKNIKTEEKTEFPCDGVFIFVGWDPNTKFLTGVVKTDEKGWILVDSGMKTSEQGVFACGDCCSKFLRQVVTACGDGATAAVSAQHYVEELKGIAYK